MDLIFNCPHCEQELAVDDSGAGTQIECPSCNKNIVIPGTDIGKKPEDDAPDNPQEENQEEAKPASSMNPMSTSAGAKEDRHFAVPQHEAPSEPLITKSLETLEASAKGTGLITIKTLRRSDCVEVGKDNFDQVVTTFLQEVGEDNLISMHPVTYSHQDLASHQWISDYGIIVIYKA